ncbi:LOW QUALITY PROTEIN: hypothetical protein PFNF135_00378 [Plasmodium falciparum NF135/5.C10]|uniref:Uncharacterized protein n=1 Tax=Plasmodium falciparum NF135/5.C10 TaxID=1036726 RepID=W4IPV4_PLAFA|nr:LOW QUALITY PROTEIN: hypothetical protein PFNF135_00378 [Plasmodium falciparum NF135/5.C10]
MLTLPIVILNNNKIKVRLNNDIICYNYLDVIIIFNNIVTTNFYLYMFFKIKRRKIKIIYYKSLLKYNNKMIVKE